MSDVGSIEYYADPWPGMPECVASAGVTTGYVQFGDGEWVPVVMLSMGDGRAQVVMGEAE